MDGRREEAKRRKETGKHFCIYFCILTRGLKRFKLLTVITVQLRGRPWCWPKPGSSVRLLGYAKPLAWQVDSSAGLADLPEEVQGEHGGRAGALGDWRSRSVFSE